MIYDRGLNIMIEGINSFFTEYWVLSGGWGGAYSSAK